MGRINWARVLLGGVLAGIVINTAEFILNASILATDWERVYAALGKDAAVMAANIPLWILWSFLVGFAGVWLYAAIRPRFGPGPKTAAIAGLAVWVIVYVTFTLAMLAIDIFGDRIIWISFFWGLVEVLLALQLGAWVYKEAQA
jgi:hypothetical protein